MPFPVFAVGELVTSADQNRIGMWLSKTQTITVAAASITVANAFSADFANYRIVLSDMVATTATAHDLQLQLNASTGSTYTTAGNFMALSTATLNAFASGATTFWTIGSSLNTAFTTVIDVISPQKLAQSFFIGTGITALSVYNFSGVDTNTAQSTGFTLTNSIANNFTAGTIRVYGYRN